jgi:hypothetical protein
MRTGLWYALRMAVAPCVAYWLGGAEYLLTWFGIDFMVGITLQGRASNKLGVRRALNSSPKPLPSRA